ncbi:hypothetical protein ACFQJ7_00650 [Halovenus rubra]|uniref:Uncharacterized protein n=2 Tax=Halovenus rubra TaxID=869890 RepID=A0ACC7E1C1_9EURY|nr:hypothetical protein [Halovenus rubra]
MAASGDLGRTVERFAHDGPALDVAANLSVTVDGIDLAINTVNERLHVQVPSVRAGFYLLGGERDRIPTISRVLSEADLTAEIRVGSAVLAVVGVEATPGMLSNLFALGAVEVRPKAVVPAALRLR